MLVLSRKFITKKSFMKISKLFHWLYAILMLLPVFAVGVKCGYVMFNKNAKDSYLGSFRYQNILSLGYLVQTSSISDISYQSNILYKYTNNLFFNNVSGYLVNDYSGNNSPTRHTLFVVSDFYIDDIYYSCTLVDLYLRDFKAFARYYTYNFNENDDYFSYYDDLIIIKSKFDDSILDTGSLIDISNKKINFANVFNYVYRLRNYTYDYLGSLNILNYFIDTSLSSVFYSALQELDNVSFFSWAKNSFLAQPFMYIGNLFGIPNVHPIFSFLSYWMAISVIWLVFDLFIYVPLLCHRWIDKGIKE